MSKNKSLDCYWYVSPEQTMKAICTECYKKDEKGFWFWKGSSVGYGNYDLNCSRCNKIIHQKEVDEK